MPKNKEQKRLEAQYRSRLSEYVRIDRTFKNHLKTVVPFDPELDDEQFDTFDEMPVDGVMVTYRVRYGPPLAALYQIELSRLQLTAKKDMMALEEQLRAKGYWRSLETA